VKILVAEAHRVAQSVNDTRLKTDLLEAALACDNFSVQLKIITAVRVATEGAVASDSESTKSIRKCARGLANAIVKTVNAAEISQLSRK